MLDLVDMLAREYEAMDPSDERFAGLGTRSEYWRSPTPSTPTIGTSGTCNRPGKATSSSARMWDLPS